MPPRSARSGSTSAQRLEPIGTAVTIEARDSGTVLLEALALLEGRGAPRGARRATGLSTRTVTKHLGRLRSAGYVAGSQRQPELTASGRAQLAAPPPATEGSWGAAIQEVWPPAYAALIRLLLDAIVARALAPGRRGQPGFIVFGPPHTYKTSIADFVASALGIVEAEAIAQLHLMAPGEIIGRRVRATGEDWRFQPSPWTRRTFVCFDELGLADDATRRHVSSYLHGESAVHIEGELVRLAPTAMVCFNQPERIDPLWPLPEATWRRCIRLATAPLKPSLPADMSQRLHAWHSGAKPAPIVVDSLELPCAELPESCWELFDGVAGFHSRCLTERGKDWHDRRAFELFVLGRAAREGLRRGDRLEALTLGVGVDLLTAADTIPGLVSRSEWTLDVGRLRVLEMVGADDVAQAVEAVTAQRAAARARAAQLERRSVTATLELAGEREALGVRISEAIATIRQVPPAWREGAGSLKKQLSLIRDKVGDAGSPERVQELAALATPYLEQVRQLRNAVDRHQAERQRALRAARTQLTELGRLTGFRKEEREAIREAIGSASRLRDAEAFIRALQDVAQRTLALKAALEEDRRQVAYASEVKTARRVSAQDLAAAGSESSTPCASTAGQAGRGRGPGTGGPRRAVPQAVGQRGADRS